MWESICSSLFRQLLWLTPCTSVKGGGGWQRLLLHTKLQFSLTKWRQWPLWMCTTLPEEDVSLIFLMATSLFSERSLSNMTTGAYAFHMVTHGSLDLTLTVRVCVCGGGGMSTRGSCYRKHSHILCGVYIGTEVWGIFSWGSLISLTSHPCLSTTTNTLAS